MRMTVTYPVKLPDDLYRRVKLRAAQEGRSAANYMRRVLDLATTGQLVLTEKRTNTGGELERVENGKAT